MAEFDWTLEPAPVLGGTDIAIRGNRIRERDDMTLISVAVRVSGEEALAQALQRGWGLDLPSPTVSAARDEVRTVRSGADQILLIGPRLGAEAHAEVQSRLEGTVYTTDQSDAFVVLEIGGPETLAALERLCPLDVASWPEGGAGRTVMEHMGAWIIRIGTDRFLLLSASSSARSFLHAVETSFRWVA